MNIYLKIKIKSLVSEAKDIRKEERRHSDTYRERKRMKRTLQNNPPILQAAKDRLEKRLARSIARSQNVKTTAMVTNLRSHRTNEVRKEARSSFIAYGFLRGTPYETIELTNKKVDWVRVESLIKKFGVEDERVLMQKFSAWKPS